MFILVYRLAMDAKTRMGDDGTARKWPSLLGDFQTGIASMTRKRHLASTARGLLGFCLMTQIEVQEVQGVQKVQLRLIRLIRLIRGKTEEPILWRTAFQAAECYVMHMSCTYSIRGLPYARQNGLFLFIALARMVTFCKEGGGMLLVWALRARSYKTKAEA